MPNEHETLSSLFSDIADAIREKTGGSESIVADTFPDAIAAIEGGGGADKIQHADIPAYVKNEALRVAENVKAAQAENSITFIVGTDAHQWDPDDGTCDTSAKQASAENIIAGNLHAGMAMKALAYALDVDFCAYLGDYSWGQPTTTSGGVTKAGTTIEEGLAHIGGVNGDIDEAFKGLPQFRTTGNHDPLTYSVSTNQDYLSEAELYPKIGAYNGIDGETVTGDTTAGYCCRDFASKKVRVICLNTAENTAQPQTDQTSEAVTVAQRQWFAETLLEVGEKSDAANWSVIIFSHHPLDWGNIASTGAILHAYVAGEQITVGSGASAQTYDFDGKNLARIAGNFHGHTHCYNKSKLKFSGTEYNAYRLAIPNMCYGRNNEYGKDGNHTYGDTVSYEKTAGSANDTAFCVVTVDLTNSIVSAFHYGAGPAENNKSRTFAYNFGVTYYNVADTLIHATRTGPSVVASGGSFTARLTPEEGYTLKDVRITMGGADVKSQYYDDATGIISIPSSGGGVTGEIRIYAAPYTNLAIDSTGTDKDGNSYTYYLAANQRLASGGGMVTDQYSKDAIVSGFIPYSYQSGDKIRVAMRKGARAADTGNYIAFYDGNKDPVDSPYCAIAGNSSGSSLAYGVWTLDTGSVQAGHQPWLQAASFIRCGLSDYSSDLPFTVTVNEVI